MNEERHVRKHNIFVEGRYRFTLNEQKVLLAVISKIRIEDMDFVPYRVSWSDIKEISRGALDTRKKIDTACQSLKNKTITIRKGRTYDNFGFLSGWEVNPGSWVEFRIDPSMRGLLLDLLASGRFTLYRLECVLGLNSAYQIRLYELLKSIQFKKGWSSMMLDDLKWTLGMPERGSYDHFGVFRSQILEKGKRDLQRHTDIKFDYRTVKEGRKVVAIQFKVTENKKARAKITRREYAQAGDTVVIQGKEYVVDGDCVRDDNGAPIPIGRINQMIKEGRAIIK